MPYKQGVMLIKFTVENWESIKEPITLSMIATQERQHAARLALIEKYRLRLLPVAAIFGANASGKTKICRALWFAKQLITTVTQPESSIKRIPFKLEKRLKNEPTRFSFQIVVNDICYEFSFAVTADKVLAEKLIQLSPYSEKILYLRDSSGKVTFPDVPLLNQDPRLHFIAAGTRENQLFLTKTVDQNKDNFLAVYQWFKNNLIVLGPDATLANGGHFIHNLNMPISAMINHFIAKLDTGITHVDEIDIPLESVQFPADVKAKIVEKLPEGGAILFGKSRVIANNRNGTVSVKKLVSYHRSIDGTETEFDFAQESAGNLTLINLLPVIFELSVSKASKTYIIDELDQSLHTLLLRSLLEYYLQTCSPASRSQLLFTTHNLMLMDQDLFRRDELWLTERNIHSATQLISLSEYKEVGNDKDIRNSYLKGSFGGIPKIF